MINYIYVLKIGGIPFYIGVTTDLKMRLSEHKVSFGKDIEIEKIDEHLGSTATAHSLEQFWIRKYLENGIVLKNKPPKSTVETNCLYCDAVTIQSSGKREKKFCSTSCRVMWNRKNKGTTKKMQITVLHNETMEALSEMKEIQKQIASDLFMFGQARSDGKPLIEGFTADTKFSVQPIKKSVWDEPEIHLVTFQELLNGMANVQFSDEKEDYAEKIRNATHLSEKQRNLLFTNLWAIK